MSSRTLSQAAGRPSHGRARSHHSTSAGLRLLLALALGAGAAAVVTGTARADVLDLAPVADTSVASGTEAGWDHGAADQLEVEQSPVRIAYLKFDLSAVRVPVVRATLTFFCTDGSPDGGSIYPVSDSSWVEGNRTGKSSTSAAGPGLKWTDLDTNGDGKLDANDTSPFVPNFTRSLAALGTVSLGQPVSVDLTAALQGGARIYSLAIKSGSTNHASYVSREGADPTQRPRLHLEIGAQSSTTTTTITVPEPTTTSTTVPATTTTTLPGPSLTTTKPAGTLHVLAGRTGACRLVAAVTGWSGPGGVVRCTDGDSCDGDAAADGSCMAAVTLCLEGSAASACGPDVLAVLKLSSDPRLQALSDAFEDMKAHMPAGASEVCMPVVSLPVAKGRLPLKLQRLGKGPRKTLALVCRPPRRTHLPRPTGGGTTYATIQKKIFDSTCATPTCHGSAAASGGLNLAAGSSYGNLVSVPAENPAAQASGALRVVPGNPDASFLFEKLLGNIKPTEGVKMPLVGRPLSAAELDLIRRWIAAGAPETAPF